MIEVDWEAMLDAARNEAEMWRTAKDRLAERLNAAERERDAAVVLLRDALFYVGAYQRNPKAEAIADELSTAIRAFLAGVPMA